MRSTAQRLRLLDAPTIEFQSWVDLVPLAVRRANDHCYRILTRPPTERWPTLPEVYQPPQSRCRVLLQVDDFTQGGMEQVVIDLAESLDPDRFSVALLVLGEKGPAAATAAERGIRILSLAGTPSETAYRQLLLDERIDLVNAHFSLFGAAIARSLNIPFVQTIHNAYAWLAPPQRRAYASADRFTSAYLCVSAEAAHYCDVKLGLSTEKIVVSPNGIDLDRVHPQSPVGNRHELRKQFGFAADDFLFLNVAAVKAAKGQIALVRAFAGRRQASA